MARFPSLCLRLVFASGVVLATAFSLQAPIQARASAAAQGKGLAFVQPKAAAAPAAAAVPVVGKNECVPCRAVPCRDWRDCTHVGTGEASLGVYPIPACS